MKRLLLIVVLCGGCSDWDFLSRALDGGMSDGSALDAGMLDGGGNDAGSIVIGGPYNYAFVSSETFTPGSFGGLAAADAECNRLASGKLPGQFVALLADSTHSLSSRLTPSGGQAARAWIRPDQKPIVDRFADAIAGKLLYPIRIDENGNDVADSAGGVVAGVPVATGANQNGTQSSTASNWTSPSGMYGAGDALASGVYWHANFDRTGPARIYCFAIDHSDALMLTKPEGRKAFLSRGTFRASDGLVAADALCQSEATSASFSGEFAALLSTTTAAASSRFDLTNAPWIRIDGIPWIERAQDLAAGRIATALNLDVTGEYSGYSQVWTGAVEPADRALSGAESCADWSASGQTGIVGWATHSSTFAFDVQAGHGCSEANARIYCLQK